MARARQPPTLSRSSPVRQRIVAAARRHFFAHGFRSVTMDDLAAELGMSKKTLYAAFPAKEALLHAVLVAKFAEIEAELGEIASGPRSDLLGTLHRLLACIRRHTGEVQAPFVRDLRREGPELFRFIEERRRALIQRYFGKIFAAGRRAGALRRDIPTRLMIEILLGATEAILNPAKIEELGLTPKSGYETVMKVVFEGLMAERARARITAGDGTGRGRR
jgi:AcrR family transcriptional regulator